MTPSPQAHAELRELATKLKTLTNTQVVVPSCQLASDAILALLDELDAANMCPDCTHPPLSEPQRCTFGPRCSLNPLIISGLEIELRAANARIAALEAQVALAKQVIGAVIQAFGIKDTPEHKTAVAKLKESLEAIDKLALTRYTQGAATKE